MNDIERQLLKQLPPAWNAPAAEALRRQAQEMRLEMEEQEAANQTFARYRTDPAFYARDVLGVEWWDMQIQIARSITQHRRTAVYAGHSVGKCVHVDDPIRLADGSQVRAGDLIGRKFFVTAVDEEMKFHSAPAEAADNGIKQIIEVETESGRTIRRTEEHPLFSAEALFANARRPRISPRGWTPVSKLKVNDLVLVPSSLPIAEPQRMLSAHVRILAYLIGDGSLELGGVKFSQERGPALDEFERDVQALGSHLVPCGPITWRVTGTGWRNNRVNDLVRAHGLWDCQAPTKHVPDAIFRLPDDQLALFLSRLYATDGWASIGKDGRAEIGFCSVSRALCDDIQLLLLRFGICARVRKKKTTWTHLGIRKHGHAWSVDILDGPMIIRFGETVGIFGKELALERTLAVARRRQRIGKQWRRRTGGSRRRPVLLPESVRWERVARVRRLGTAPTVAITVPRFETFVTTFIEHNTHGMGGVCQWHYDCYDPSITLTTAPSWPSIHDLLWGEIRTQRPPGAPGHLTQLRLESAPMHYIAGHNADSGSGFQGRHEARVLLVLDEAMGIPPYIWTACNAMMTSPDCRIIALGNPTENSGEYYDIRDDPDWNVINISCLDHPNITAELAGLPVPYPKAVHLVWINEMLKKHAARVRDEEIGHSVKRGELFEFPRGSGQWWMPDDDFRSRVLGVFPKQAARSIFSEEWLILARIFNPKLAWALTQLPEIGCDVARYGNDSTVLYGRRGPIVLCRETYAKQGTMETAGRCSAMAHQLAKEHGCNPFHVPIKVDDTGLGGGVTDRLRELGYNVYGINFGGKAVDEEEYFNRGAEMWFDVANRARDERLDLSRLDPDAFAKLSKELRARQYKIQSDKKLRVESKDDYIKRTKHSPDDADALVLAFAPSGLWEVLPMGDERPTPKPSEPTAAYVQQMHDTLGPKFFPSAGGEVDTQPRCGGCVHWEPKKRLDGSVGFCVLRHLSVEAKEIGCELHELAAPEEL